MNRRAFLLGAAAALTAAPVAARALSMPPASTMGQVADWAVMVGDSNEWTSGPFAWAESITDVYINDTPAKAAGAHRALAAMTDFLSRRPRSLLDVLAHAPEPPPAALELSYWSKPPGGDWAYHIEPLTPGRAVLLRGVTNDGPL